MKKILIINKCNSSNLGDQAIGRSMKLLVERNGYQAECIDLTNASKHKYVRDYNSYINLQNIFGISSTVIPDVVFSAMFVSSEKKENYALLGVTAPYRLNYYNFCNSMEEYFESLYLRLVELEKKYENVKLIYSDNNDRASAKALQEWIQIKYAKNVEVENYMTLDDMLDAIERAKYIESPRMHALILGLLAKCEVNAIKISPKIWMFSEMYLCKEVSIEELNSQVTYHFNNMMKF